MKYAIVALAALASLALASGANMYDKPGYESELRSRLGHFRSDPFDDMFKQYAAAFIKPNHPEREPDDYRNYEPSADGCRLFFDKFRENKMVLEDLPDLIELDGCLGYVVGKVYENDEHATADQKQYFTDLLANEDYNLAALYNTGLDKIEDKSRGCMAALLHGATNVKAQFRDVGCNNHMVQVYLQFAECQKGSEMLQLKDTDPYVKMIYDLLGKRVNLCTDTELIAIDMAVNEKFGQQYFRKPIEQLSTKKSGAKRQQSDRTWPSEVVDLFRAVLDDKEIIGMREANEQLYYGFRHNIARYADQEIRPNSRVGFLKNRNDPTGRFRYTELVDGLCKPFKSSDSEDDFDYATSLVRMVKLLNHVELFGSAKDKFTRNFIYSVHATAPIYFCVAFCNKLSFTEGFIKGSGDEAHYAISWKRDLSTMVDWPYVAYYL